MQMTKTGSLHYVDIAREVKDSYMTGEDVIYSTSIDAIRTR